MLPFASAQGKLAQHDKMSNGVKQQWHHDSDLSGYAYLRLAKADKDLKQVFFGNLMFEILLRQSADQNDDVVRARIND